jgi:hypothetical protein
MAGAVVKVLIVQKKLIEQLGVVCGSLLRGFLSYQYGDQWTGSPSQEDFVKRFSSKPAPAIAKKLGDFLKRNTESQHGGARALVCCEGVEKCYSELDNIVKGMEPKQSFMTGYFWTSQTETCLCHERTANISFEGLLRHSSEKIEECVGTSVRVLANLKYVLDEDSAAVRARWSFSRHDRGKVALMWTSDRKRFIRM